MKSALTALTIAAAMFFSLAPANAKTNVVTYGVKMHMKGTSAKGYCWTGSLASGRTDAYRCMIGNSIMDPCFAVSSKVVNCPQDVAANTGIVLTLTKPLPKNTGMKNATPWRFQLAGGSGITCSAGTGTVIANYPYYCQGNLVCSVPVVTGGTYAALCGTPAGPLKVKAPRRRTIGTVWN